MSCEVKPKKKIEEITKGVFTAEYISKGIGLEVLSGIAGMFENRKVKVTIQVDLMEDETCA